MKPKHKIATKLEQDQALFDKRLDQLSVHPETGRLDAMFALGIRVLIGIVDEKVFGRKNTIGVYFDKQGFKRRHIACFVPSSGARKACYGISLGHVEKTLETQSLFSVKYLCRNGQRRKRRPNPKPGYALFTLAVHEVRHRVQYTHGRGFRFFRPESAKVVKDPLLRKVIQDTTRILKVSKQGKDREARGFARWLARPHEFDAWVLEKYAMHVLNVNSTPKKRFREVLWMQEPE